MPRGRPKSTKAVSKLTQALTETLAAQTDAAQAVVVQEKLDEVAAIQRNLEGELDNNFNTLRAYRIMDFDKTTAPGAKVNLEAVKVMLEHTHRLHPERGGPQGERVTVNVLVQLLAKPTTMKELPSA